MAHATRIARDLPVESWKVAWCLITDSNMMMMVVVMMILMVVVIVIVIIIMVEKKKIVKVVVVIMRKKRCIGRGLKWAKKITEIFLPNSHAVWNSDYFCSFQVTDASSEKYG